MKHTIKHFCKTYCEICWQDSCAGMRLTSTWVTLRRGWVDADHDDEPGHDDQWWTWWWWWADCHHDDVPGDHMRLMMMMTLFSEFHCTREQRGQLGSESQDWSRGSTFPYTQVIQSLWWFLWWLWWSWHTKKNCMMIRMIMICWADSD